ncbi:MAG: UDP-3-O-[3-hydroxymyristoyl] N-acetylglucosamine deacetylase [Candidatus Omnitrophica bacterium]|nr:UDP-3-O-[3-hydroxymyristoyl] N-acetylglucosamine deacetylase [Candidatus Omnitrophota bacterium]
MNQRTIKNPVTLSGVGLHSGKMARMTIKPAGDNAGVCFVRTDLPGKPTVKVTAANAVNDEKISRCSAIESQGVRIYTVEHVMAALNGLGIDNVTIEIDGEEVPGLDGSSLEISKAFQQEGIVEGHAPQNIFVIQEPIVVSNKTATLVIVPHDQLSVSYTLNYDHPLLRSQFYSQAIDAHSFASQLAAARTFCLESEVEEIKSCGLAKGANYQNTLVMSAQGPLENTLRFPDECARHKVLDIVGDLFLLGYPVRGAVYATKSGHRLNRALVRKIEAQRQKYNHVAYGRAKAPEGSGRVYNIDEIMKVLPHRYPFLFVDRVIEIEAGKKGIGIKNVTINDAFFQGHFPQKAVMPGVIMIEAMAQTAGIVVLTSGTHNGKVALFMSISDVKFRKVVYPGDQLLMEVEIIRDRERTAHVKGVGRVGADVAIEAQMTFSYTDANYLNG